MPAKRGRPPKAVLPKKRGRPPKTITKKVGRPPGRPPAKKRGRPPKAKPLPCWREVPSAENGLVRPLDDVGGDESFGVTLNGQEHVFSMEQVLRLAHALILVCVDRREINFLEADPNDWD
jgi:hypothetical protein